MPVWLQRVASLAAEARTLIGEDGLSEGEDSPLRRAKNPRDLALLVKRYRLIEVGVSGVMGLLILERIPVRLIEARVLERYEIVTILKMSKQGS